MNQEIIKLAKQLYTIKYSKNMKKCIETSIGQVLGWSAFSKMCLELGISKDEYINELEKGL